MSPGKSFETIADLLARALVDGTDRREVFCLIVQARTHAMIQAGAQRQRELRAEKAAHLETGALQ